MVEITDNSMVQVRKGQPNFIAVCTMVKNEADIIESFCRHALLYADVLLITDHMSTDGTMEILQSLQSEGLPVYLWHSYEAGKHQAFVMSALMKRAVNDYGADLVVLADADEFLVSPKGDAEYIRKLLQNLPLLDKPGAYSLKLVTSEFEHMDESDDVFALSREIRRESVASGVIKVLACRSAVEDFDLEVAEGNHGLMSAAKRRQGLIKVDVPNISIGEDELYILHLPARSEAQFLSKCFCGWLSQVAQNTRFGYFAPQYKAVWEKYLQGKWQMGRLKDSILAMLETYKGECQLKYTKRKIDPLANIMQVAEIFAEGYLREKMKGARPSLSMLLLVDNWQENADWARKTLTALAGQDYPIAQVLVLVWRSEMQEAQKGLTASFAGTVIFAREAAAKLKEAVQGSYVKWLLPGDEMKEGFLSRLMLLLQTNPMACTATSGIEILTKPAETDIDRWGWDWELPAYHAAAAYWRMIFLRGGVHLPMCLASTVFRRDVMQNTNFLAGGVLSREIAVFHNLSTWIAILEAIQKLEPTDGAVFWLKEVLAKTEIMWDESHRKLYENDRELVHKSLLSV